MIFALKWHQRAKTKITVRYTTKHDRCLGIKRMILGSQNISPVIWNKKKSYGFGVMMNCDI